MFPTMQDAPAIIKISGALQVFEEVPIVPMIIVIRMKPTYKLPGDIHEPALNAEFFASLSFAFTMLRWTSSFRAQAGHRIRHSCSHSLKTHRDQCNKHSRQTGGYKDKPVNIYSVGKIPEPLMHGPPGQGKCYE
jgi:hypothetical protein